MISDLISTIKITMLKLNGFCDTYMGIFNEKGEQVESGDRDAIFNMLINLGTELQTIKENQKRIEEKLDKLLKG